MNKASCLSLLCNAVLVWNTVQMSRIIRHFQYLLAQDGFQGVDKSPSLQGDLPCIGHLFARGQGAILVS
jgi:Tn3 transposase DDE domain